MLTRACERCGKREDDCSCGDSARPGDSEELLRLRREKRRGKPVTVVAAEGVDETVLRGLARDLKSRLASGGTAKNGEIELQGDHLDRVRALLVDLGYRVKG